MPIQITAPFALPFGLVRNPAAPTLNPRLHALFLSKALAAPGQYANPKATMSIEHGLFESRFDLFRWPEPEVAELRQFCWSSLFELVASLNGYNMETMSKLQGHADAWFHIMRNGAYFGLHNHPMASWSGVYCVSTGDPDPTVTSSGVLSFPNPLAQNAMYVDPGNAQLKMPYSSTNREFRLSPGELVLFPSHALHQVLPFQGLSERITVAFNAWFTIPGGMRPV